MLLLLLLCVKLISAQVVDPVSRKAYWSWKKTSEDQAAEKGGRDGKCPGARRLLGAQQGPQSTVSTYENKSIQAEQISKISIGPVTALYDRARDRSAQGPGFSLRGPAEDA